MEIVLRSAAIFLIIAVLLRAMGRRELAEITTLELVILVIIGDMVQQGVTQEDMSVTGAALAISTMGLLAVGGSMISARFPRARPVLEGRPLVVVRNGEMLPRAMRQERITDDEVLEAARKRGIADLADVAWCIVEADGRFSFIQHEEGADGSGEADEEGQAHI